MRSRSLYFGSVSLSLPLDGLQSLPQWEKEFQFPSGGKVRFFYVSIKLPNAPLLPQLGLLNAIQANILLTCYLRILTRSKEHWLPVCVPLRALRRRWYGPSTYDIPRGLSHGHRDRDPDGLTVSWNVHRRPVRVS